MRKPWKLVLRLMAALMLLAAVLIGLETRRVWKGYHDTKVITAGPFDSSVPTLYPDHKKAIQHWFLINVPLGTTRNDARKILSSSFSVDLTSGKKIDIESDGSTAGSSKTSIRLRFDGNDRLVSVEVDQHWAYL